MSGRRHDCGANNSKTSLMKLRYRCGVNKLGKGLKNNFYIIRNITLFQIFLLLLDPLY
jgi:hypothetical protein